MYDDDEEYDLVSIWNNKK